MILIKSALMYLQELCSSVLISINSIFRRASITTNAKSLAEAREAWADRAKLARENLFLKRKIEELEAKLTAKKIEREGNEN